MNIGKMNNKAQAVVGLPFVRLSQSEFIEYLNLALNQKNNVQSFIFADAETVTHSVSDPRVRDALFSADILIPRGKGVNARLNMRTRGPAEAANTSQLYIELLLTLETKGSRVLLFSDSKRDLLKFEIHAAKYFPSLNIQFQLLDINYDLSTKSIKSMINKNGAEVVMFAAQSPIQEQLVSRLQGLTKLKLVAALGHPFFEAVSEIEGQSLWHKVRHSLLLRPIKLFRFILANTALYLKSTDKDSSRLNRMLKGWGWTTRLSRLLIRLKAWWWSIRCNLQRITKRIIDMTGAILGLLALSPLLIPVIIIVKASSPGPLFYSQIRVGHRGKLFRMWKFRSMYIDADARKAALLEQNESAAGVIFKMKKDPRITPIGRFIRRLSVDELPQLYNVLIGEMSLVGPRPALESEVAQYPVLARARLEAIPGLTGLWQISGRSDLPFDKQVLLDTVYVNHQSAINDIKLIAKTIPAIVSGKGAY